jgi:uncharacterized protein
LIGGQWVGVQIRCALDQVRADGLKAIALCPFVKAHIEKHPEYAGLVK